MPERWLAWCRSLVPEALRADAFDPAAADLMHDFCAWQDGRGRATRALAQLRLRVRLLWAALECRRLAVFTNESTSPWQASLPWGTFGKGTMLRDLATITRRLAREPRFTATVVLTLALGLGANLTVFTFVDAYLLAPLPLSEPHRLVRVYADDGLGGFDTASYPNYRDARDGAAPALDLAAHAQTMALVGAPGPRR